MFRRLLAHPIVHIALTGAIALSVFFCVFPDVVPRFSWLVNYAVVLMLFFLVAGLVFFFLKQPKLTFAFFGGCALLCFFLKYSVKGDGIQRWRDDMFNERLVKGNEPEPVRTELKIAHFNLSHLGRKADLPDVIGKLDADILSVHEVTPMGDRLLKEAFAESYPFSHTLVDIGIYGLAVYSKYEIENIDTFYYKDVPNLCGQITKEGEAFNFVSVHTLPALNEYSKRRLQQHLKVVEGEVNRQVGPLFLFGDFNSVTWSGQIQQLLDDTGLMESRMGFMPYSVSGGLSFTDLPFDHIFYTGHFTCLNFQIIQGTDGQHLGILGAYRFPKKRLHG